jgi:hypothetical protein
MSVDSVEVETCAEEEIHGLASGLWPGKSHGIVGQDLQMGLRGERRPI